LEGEDINKKIIISGVAGVLLTSMIGSLIGNMITKPTDSAMKELIDNLSISTSMLVETVNKIIPVVDTVDDNVKVLTDKVDALDFKSKDAVEIYGMKELMASVEGLVARVIGIDNKVDSFGTKITDGHQKISNQISKIEFGAMNYFRTSDGAKLKSFDPSRARRVLCVNRVGRVKCLPGVDSKTPRLNRGYIKECILYDNDLHCGTQKKFN